jgi:hypothetical protein
MAEVLMYFIAPQAGKVFIEIKGSLWAPDEIRDLAYKLLNALTQCEELQQQVNGGLIVPKRPQLVPREDLAR